MGDEDITEDEVVSDLLEAFGARPQPRREDGWRTLQEITAETDMPYDTLRAYAVKAVKLGKVEFIKWGGKSYFRLK